MFGIDSSEFLLVALVALVVIGPKDLPKAMRLLGYWVGKARGVARQFRSGFDSMVREAELEEMEKRWAAENARIMREHPASAVLDAEPAGTDAGEAPAPAPQPDLFEGEAPAIHVEKPVIVPAAATAAPPAPTPDGAAS